MSDFTLNAYQGYLIAIKNKFPSILTFKEYFDNPNFFDHFCLIRHDVDRKPVNSVNMARIENSLGIKATYHFRTRSYTLKESNIKEIHELGHEIGYHYECLSDTNGNIDAALLEFEKNLNRLRNIVPV